MGGRTDREERFELCRAKRRSEKLGKALSAFWRQSSTFSTLRNPSLVGPRRKKRQRRNHSPRTMFDLC